MIDLGFKKFLDILDKKTTKNSCPYCVEKWPRFFLNGEARHSIPPAFKGEVLCSQEESAL